MQYLALAQKVLGESRTDPLLQSLDRPPAERFHHFSPLQKDSSIFAERFQHFCRKIQAFLQQQAAKARTTAMAIFTHLCKIGQK